MLEELALDQPPSAISPSSPSNFVTLHSKRDFAGTFKVTNQLALN